MTKARDLANASTALSAVDATELGYLNGVTSAVQTQLNAKQPTVANVSDTEIGYLDGVTSAIQTQLNAKAVYPSQTGNSGKYLTTDGSTASWGTVSSPPDIAGKNKIINGDFKIWQRGTSFSASGQMTADRWKWAGGPGTISRQAFTPGTAPVAGYEGQYYLNWTLTGNSQNIELQQNIEDARTFAGQTVTLSFWARSTVGAQAQNAYIYQNFGTGGSPSSMVNAGGTSYTPTASWQRFSFTFNIPSVAGKTFGTNNDSYLWVRVAQMTTTATNTSIDIWGVQLEAGSTATGFTTATGNPQGELAACSRYFQRYGTGAASFYVFGGLTRFTDGAYFGSTAAHQNFVFPVPMRTTPSMSTTGTWKGFGNSNHDAVGSLSIQFGNNQGVFIRFEKSSGSFNSDTGYVQSNDGGYVNFNAEL